MGETLDKNTNMKTRETLQVDITVANKITGNDLFRNKTGVNITFYFHGEENIIGYVVTETSKLNISEGKIHDMNNIVDTRLKLKRIKLNYNQFYRFYNTLLNSLSIFYEEKYKTKKQSSNNSLEICCICDEKISNVMLNCYHLFCEKCIETWLIKKQSNCPLCRVDINISQDKELNKGNSIYCWSLIDINNNDYIKERNELFEASLDSILALEDYPHKN